MGMTSFEFVESQRPKTAVKKAFVDEYDKTVKELKDLRESQISFFNKRKNDLDEDINKEREIENKTIISELLKDENYNSDANKENENSEEAEEEEEENVELNHSSNFVNKSIKLNENQLKQSTKAKNDLFKFDAEEEDSEGSDLDSIEELFRKSCMGLKELTSEIQTLNQEKSLESNPKLRSERSKAKNLNRKENITNVPNTNLNKLNRLKSKDKILINEEELIIKEKITAKKPSSAEELIKEAEREKAKMTDMPIISDRSFKKQLILPNANSNLVRIAGPKLIIKKNQEQSSFSSNNNNNSLIDEKLDKKPSNKLIFKQTSIINNPLKPLEAKISPNSTLTQMKQNLNNNNNNNNNNNSYIDLNSSNSPAHNLNNLVNHKSILSNKPSLNNANNTINSGKINFNSKINLLNFNHNDAEKTNNTSVITQNSSNTNNQTTENPLNTSSNSSTNNIFKNLNASHRRFNSNLSNESSSLIMGNIASNGLNPVDKNNKITIDDINYKYKTNANSSDNDKVINEGSGINTERALLNKNFDSEKILINNKINDVNNIRNNINLKKPAIMGAAYGNTGNPKPVIKNKTEITKK